MAYTQDQVALAIIAEGQTARTTGPSECQHPVITPKGIQIALATAIVESNEQVLANPNVPESENYPNDGDGYDHASAGPFQQQYMWWGTVAEEMDPRLSAAMFYNHLARLPENYNSDTQSPGGYAQDVQGSAFPDRYDQHWDEAVAQYNRLVGQVGSAPAEAEPAPFTETDLTQNNENCEDRGGASPRLIILHTEEGQMTGSAFEQWMANNGVSYGYIVNPDGSVIDMETDDVASWSVLSPANEVSINICFAGSYSGWTRNDWLNNVPDAIRSAAYLTVREARKFGIPLNILVGNNYSKVKTEAGITDHNGITVTQLSPGSNHTDVGPGFPWDIFNQHLQKYASGAAGTTTQGDDFLSALSSEEQATLRDRVNEIWGALFTPVESQSIYRDPDTNGETAPGSLWAEKDFIRNDDGLVHAIYVEHSALLGDPDALRRVVLVAAGKGAATDAASVARAKRVLQNVPADILQTFEKELTSK